MTETNKTKIVLGALFKIVTIEGSILTFQNFWQENEGKFLFEDDEYQYLPIEYQPPERNISLDNTEINLVLPVNKVLINLLENYNYFKNAEVQAYLVLDGFPNVPIIAMDRGEITSYQIQESKEGTAINIVISSPFDLTNGRVPNLIYTTNFNNEFNVIGNIPEALITFNPQIN